MAAWQMAAGALLLAPAALTGCSSEVRSPVVSVTNTGQAIVGPVSVSLGGERLDFGQLRAGEKRRISYRPSADTPAVEVRWPQGSAVLDRPVSVTDPGSLGNDVNILLDGRTARLDPKKNSVRNAAPAGATPAKP